MSLWIKRDNGRGNQKIAGHTIILDANASEVREGTVSITTQDNPPSDFQKSVLFAAPMPDKDFVVILSDDSGSWHCFYKVVESSKTVNGFTIQGVWESSNTSPGIKTFDLHYYAFKPIKLEGYNELQNKITNPDNVPTENSENLVKSGGVWEAIKNASSVFVGTEAGWEAADHTKWDIAVLTDKHMILSVNRTSGESAEQANLDKVFDGTQAEWDALTDEQRNYYDHAMIKTNTYTTNPGTLIVAHDMTVATGDWVADTTYDGFGFKADISVAGVTAKHSPEVRFSFADANSGKFAGVADCADGKVTVYANAVPDADITVPVIICTLMEV